MNTQNDIKSFQAEIVQQITTREFMEKSKPEEMIARIDKIILICKECIQAERDIFLKRKNEAQKLKRPMATNKPISWSDFPYMIWKKNQQLVFIEFGKWSNIFNKFLRIKLKKYQQVNGPDDLKDAQSYQMVYLYWQRAKSHVLAFNSLTEIGFIDTLSLNADLNALNYIKEKLEEI